VFGFLRTLVPLILANAAGTVLGALLLAGLDQKTFAVLITAMVVLFLARGDRIVGEPAPRAAADTRRRVRRRRHAGNDIVVLLVASVAILLWRTFVA